MSSRNLRFIVGLSCLAVLTVWAGEIVILQTAPEDASHRNASESRRLMDDARQNAGKSTNGPTTVILSDDPGGIAPSDRNRDSALDSGNEARDYLRTPSASSRTSDSGGTVMLRAAPVREGEYLQQRARSYVAPTNSGRQCNGGNAGSQIGSIGEGPNAIKGNVMERGTNNVDAQGNCR